MKQTDLQRGSYSSYLQIMSLPATIYHSEAQAVVEEISNGEVKLNFDHCNQSGRPLYLTFLLLKSSF